MSTTGRMVPVAFLASVLAGCQYMSGASELSIASGDKRQPSWECLGSPPVFDPDEDIHYSGSVRNLADESIIDDVTLRVCESAEPACTSPLITTAAVDGIVDFKLKASFFGYIELSSPGMMPAIVELSRPLGQMRRLPEFRLVDASRFRQISMFVGVTPDDALGHVQYWVQDCNGQKARGVELEVRDPLPDSTQQYYAIDATRPSVSADRTDDSGGGGFVNLPTGFLTFRARLAADDTLLSEYSVRIRPGQITYSVVEPD